MIFPQPLPFETQSLEIPNLNVPTKVTLIWTQQVRPCFYFRVFSVERKQDKAEQKRVDVLSALEQYKSNQMCNYYLSPSNVKCLKYQKGEKFYQPRHCPNTSQPDKKAV